MATQKLKRVYHPVDQWEEIGAGMWDDTKNWEEQLALAIGFTRNHTLYGEYMRRVISEWPVSCENALTDYNLNRRAWVGHAACALAHGLPEDIVRKAWSFLTDVERALANREADRAIALWENTRNPRAELPETMAEPLLFE